MISFFIIFSSTFYFKSVEFINIFYFKDLSVNQKHISRQNLFQKINMVNYQLNKNNKKYQNKLFSYNYYGKGSFSLKSERWNEYRSFFNQLYKKYFLRQTDVKFESFYHNFYMTEFSRLGFPSLFLISYLILLNFINFKSSLKTRKIENICSSLIYLSIFSYVCLFDAHLSANLRSLILLIIVLFILNKYNERNTKKI